MSVNDPLIGQKLGDYTIQTLLGQGGMARVYKGYDERLDRYAAVKVIEPNLVASDDDEEYRERFLREARAIARLNHPRVVGVFQFGQREPLYYMAMVFVDGKDLRQILKEHNKEGKRLTNAQILRIVRDISEALDYSHEQGVIHRDVKPSNIMVTADGHAVLTDFGLALNAQEGTIGNTFGSVHYIAPEQAVSSAQAVPQSDLYSLGVVLYEVLTGRVPFEDVSAMSVALKHISDPPPPPSMMNPAITSQVEEVVIKSLDKDPKKRFKTGLAMVHALEAAFAASEEEDTHELDRQRPKTDSEILDSWDSPIPSPVPSKSNIDDDTISDSSLGELTLEKSLPFLPVEGEATRVARPARRTNNLWFLLFGLIFIAVLGGGLILANGGLGGTESPTEVSGISTQQTEFNTRGVVDDTEEPTPSETPSPRPTATHDPTKTDTPRPTNTPTTTSTATPTSTASVTPTPSRTLTPSITPTPRVNALNAEDPSLMLRYDGQQLVIYNRASDGTLIDVRRLSFIDTEGSVAFNSQDWSYDDARWVIRPQIDCFQILEQRFVELPAPSFCMILQAFERTDNAFWVTENGDGYFQVVLNRNMVIGECPTVPVDMDIPVRCVVDVP